MEYNRKKSTNHKWTDEERAIVGRNYTGSNASAQTIADYLGVTRCAVKGQAQKLGIMQQKSPPWTKKELRRLEQLIHRKSIGQIARELHRSKNAVKVKATRLKLRLRLRDGWYNKKDACEICGVDHKKIQQWIDTGHLKATWHYDRAPSKAGMSSWHIEERDLREFIINYSGEMLGRNVDIQQIVWLLTTEQLPPKYIKKGGEQVTTGYPAEFVAQNEIKVKAWRTDQHTDAKQLRDSAARELRKESWTVECYKHDYTDLGRFVLYGFDAFRKRTC